MPELRNKRRHAKVFNYPWCIYCGGETPATTVDHVPARIMFDGRIRPKGLEFPSCVTCNEGTKTSEQVAAVLCRCSPDLRTVRAQTELEELLKALSRNAPEVLQEMYVPKAKAKFSLQRLGKSSGGVLRLDGPTISAHLEVFAAKLAFAFHFFAVGTPIPKSGGAVTILYSNASVIQGRSPDVFVEHFGSPRTLQQGAKNVGDQFKYGVAATEGGGMSMGFASFRESLAFGTFAANETSKLLVDGDFPSNLFRPGDLQKPVKRPEFPTISALFKTY